MALIKSISGIRGTIGGKTGDNLTPLDIVKFTAAYGTLLLNEKGKDKDTSPGKIVVGRDGRISGGMVKNLVISTLTALGFDVIDVDYSTTPTVEMAVVFEGAAGGIILTASHNPKERTVFIFECANKERNSSSFLGISSVSFVLGKYL